MRDLSGEILTLVERYNNNYNQLLSEHTKLEYLYAFSDIRENVLEWYDFVPNGRLLQIGADYGALTGLFLERVGEVVVLDSEEKQLRVCRKRYQRSRNLICERGRLIEELPKTIREGTFDHIVMIGSLGAHAEEQLLQAKKLLRQNGTLMIAVCNPFGVKYLAGAVKDRYSFSRNQLLKLFDKEQEHLEWYYPMPDYRMASTVYSEQYLPKKGDLTKTLAIYDHPKYEQLEIGAMFDAVCEDGQFNQFANSFLVIWRKYGTD